MRDDAAQERAHAIFDPVAAEHLAREGVDIGPMFGSEGLRIRGKVYAFVSHRGALVVKLPGDRISELESTASVERMTMRGRAMKEWAVIHPEREPLWAPLVAEAFTFVDALTP